jgi:hypothetical protein
VGDDDGVFVFVARWYKLVEKTEEFVDLYAREVCVVAGVFNFESVDMFAFSGHYVWKRVEAWVAYRDAHSIVAFFLQKFDQDGFAVEAPFAPTPEFDAVNFCSHVFSSLSSVSIGVFVIIIVAQEHCKMWVWAMLWYSNFYTGVIGERW